MFPHFWYAPEEMARRVEELRREAETDRLGRRVMGASRPALAHRRLLHELGRGMVVLGSRLEQHGLQPCTPLQGGVDCAG